MVPDALLQSVLSCMSLLARTGLLTSVIKVVTVPCISDLKGSRRHSVSVVAAVRGLEFGRNDGISQSRGLSRIALGLSSFMNRLLQLQCDTGL